MKALLSDLGGGQWRVREAAALAMSDLLQGRRWQELQPHFAALWAMTLRVRGRRWWGAWGLGRGGQAVRCCGVHCPPPAEGGAQLPAQLPRRLSHTHPLEHPALTLLLRFFIHFLLAPPGDGRHPFSSSSL